MASGRRTPTDDRGTASPRRSNVIIDHLRAGEDPIQRLLERFPLTDLITCGVVKAEVLRGVRSVAARDRLCGLFEVMRFVDTNAALWDEAWNLAWTLDRKGITPPADRPRHRLLRAAGRGRVCSRAIGTLITSRNWW